MQFSHHRTKRESLLEYGRGVAGGLIVSLPLLYTMEVWWTGFLLNPWRLLAYVVCTFGLLLLYNRFAGLRPDASLAEVAIDSVEEMGIGVVVAAFVLWLTGRLDPQFGAYEMTGKVLMEAMTVAVGVSVGSAQLGDAAEDEQGGMADDDDAGGEVGYLSQTSIALCGAVLFVASIAPTEEVEIIAMESSPLMLVAMVITSILGGAWVLHRSEMHGADRHVLRDAPRLRGIVTTYAVALIAAAGCMYFFGRLDGQPFFQIVAMTVVAGIPATLGASAGRLLLQSNSPT